MSVYGFAWAGENAEKIENVYVISGCRFSALNQSNAQIERMKFISVSDFLTIFFYCSVFF
jgi:hypothetical protein